VRKTRRGLRLVCLRKGPAASKRTRLPQNRPLFPQKGRFPLSENLPSRQPLAEMSATKRACKHFRVPGGSPLVPLPVNIYVSGSTHGGLYSALFYKCRPNTWTRPRKVVRRLNLRIDGPNVRSPFQSGRQIKIAILILNKL
jgi:hypothetical protein